MNDADQAIKSRCSEPQPLQEAVLALTKRYLPSQATYPSPLRKTTCGHIG
jgi:hypothetical protein